MATKEFERTLHEVRHRDGHLELVLDRPRPGPPFQVLCVFEHLNDTCHGNQGFEISCRMSFASGSASSFDKFDTFHHGETPIWRAVFDAIEVSTVEIETVPFLPPATPMPGPRNSKRQRRLNTIKEKKRKDSQKCRVEAVPPMATPNISGNATRLDPEQQIGGEGAVVSTADVVQRVELNEQERTLLREPPVYDSGTGPRVKSMGEFLRSSFTSEPTWDDELCAEFAQEEMLEMLREVLPEEMALCVWYNKSRRRSRVCPACWRVFQTGDVLSSPLRGLRLPEIPQKVYPQLVAEQGISGLCSNVCFVLASSKYPEAIRLMFGRTGAEMEEITWEYLNAVGTDVERDDGGLSMMLKMTRLDDLGLSQLLFS